MKKGLVAVCLLAASLIVMAVLSGCSAGVGKDDSVAVTPEKRVTSAKIRYFDGSMDTVLLKGFTYTSSGMVVLHTDDGRKVVIGANNVMIIEESEAQYNCVE